SNRPVCSSSCLLTHASSHHPRGQDPAKGASAAYSNVRASSCCSRVTARTEPATDPPTPPTPTTTATPPRRAATATGPPSPRPAPPRPRPRTVCAPAPAAPDPPRCPPAAP